LIFLPQPPVCWDYRHASLCTALKYIFLPCYITHWQVLGLEHRCIVGPLFCLPHNHT
jgi:hypothetical protein